MHLEMQLLEPWIVPVLPEILEQELKKELGSKHVLYAKSVRAIAKAEDRDDVLFEVGENGSVAYALVHLTWTSKPEADPSFPNAHFFATAADWLDWMRADHAEYTSR